MQDLVDTIIRVIVDRLNPDLDPKALTPETSLIGRGLGLDSVAILELISGLESELDVMVDESELDPDALKDIGSLARFMSQQAG